MKTELQRLNELERTFAEKKHPTIPKEWLYSRKHKDTKANDLTKCIMRWAELNGHQAKRVNVMGIPKDNRRVVTDCLGFQKTIGSVEWRPSGSTRGASDISLICQGRAYEVEIKIGKDRQSEVQRSYQAKVERAGGVYIIARSFSDFIEKISVHIDPWMVVD